MEFKKAKGVEHNAFFINNVARMKELESKSLKDVVFKMHQYTPVEAGIPQPRPTWILGTVLTEVLKDAFPPENLEIGFFLFNKSIISELNQKYDFSQQEDFSDDIARRDFNISYRCPVKAIQDLIKVGDLNQSIFHSNI